MKKLTITERAYVAGILDGEGWFGWGNPGVGRGRPRPIIEVSSIDRELIEWLHAKCGGFMPTPRASQGTRQTLFRWKIQGAGCRELIAQVAPYLVIERRQDKALEMLRGPEKS